MGANENLEVIEEYQRAMRYEDLERAGLNSRRRRSYPNGWRAPDHGRRD